LVSRVVDWSGPIRCPAPSALASQDGGALPPPLTSVSSPEAPPPVRHRGRPRSSSCSPLKQRKWIREKGDGDGPYRGNEVVEVGVGRPYLHRGDEAQILLPKPRSTPTAAGRGSWRRLSHHRGCAEATSNLLSLQPLLPCPVVPITGRMLQPPFPAFSREERRRRHGRTTDWGGRE
jgi:hypothetical protein